MCATDFYQVMNEVSQTQEDHSDFYELAEKYGFCTPWCHLENDCSICEKK